MNIFNMKSKFKYIIPVVLVVGILIFGAFRLTADNVTAKPTETTFSSTVKKEIITTVTKTVESFKETVSASVPTTVTTTEKATSKPLTTAETKVHSTTEKQTATNPTLPFTIPVPDFQIPGLTPETTTAPTTTINSGEYDPSCFDSTVFIGNSRFMSFKNYGLAKNVYSVVGLNVDTVFTKSAAGSSIPVIDELKGKSYKKVILMFGDNECGWPNQNVFIEKYAKVIAAVRERIPDAEIYLHAILPVSSQASATNEFGCNNTTINSLNEKIVQLAADEGINYIPQPECVKTADGTLIPEAASDGIHLNKKYAKLWIISIAEKIIY